MGKLVYLSNLSPDITLDHLTELLAPHGVIEDLRFVSTSETVNTAMVQVQSHREAVSILHLNGQLVAERRLSASWAKPGAFTPPRSELEQQAQSIGDKLGETKRSVLILIRKIIGVCGLEFVEALVEEAMLVDASGGMMTLNDSRPRTLGGIFFYLARSRMSWAARGEVYFSHRKQKKQAEGKTEQTNRQARKASAPDEISVESPVSAQPAPIPPEIEHQLADLRRALAAAQETVNAIKTQSVGKQPGLFSAIKAVVDLQKQIDALLKVYPQLADV